MANQGRPAFINIGQIMVPLIATVTQISGVARGGGGFVNYSVDTNLPSTTVIVRFARRLTHKALHASIL